MFSLSPRPRVYVLCNSKSVTSRVMTYYRLNIIKHAFDSNFVKNSRPGAKINDVNIVLQFLIDVCSSIKNCVL